MQAALCGARAEGCTATAAPPRRCGRAWCLAAALADCTSGGRRLPLPGRDASRSQHRKGFTRSACCCSCIVSRSPGRAPAAFTGACLGGVCGPPDKALPLCSGPRARLCAFDLRVAVHAGSDAAVAAVSVHIVLHPSGSSCSAAYSSAPAGERRGRRFGCAASRSICSPLKFQVWARQPLIDRRSFRQLRCECWIIM